MNAASRLVHQGAVARHLYMIYSTLLSRKQAATVVLAVFVILSALATIYVTHINRELHANFQRNIVEINHNKVKHGQLLLERSTWMMQARIQHIAEHELAMTLPDHHSVVIVRK